jgi:uncharacterized protein YjbI with pentapeptide repeats
MPPIGMSLRGVHLINVHLIDIVYLTGIHLTGVHLIGVYLTGIYLIGVSLTLVVPRENILSEDKLSGNWTAGRIRAISLNSNFSVYLNILP